MSYQCSKCGRTVEDGHACVCMYEEAEIKFTEQPSKPSTGFAAEQEDTYGKTGCETADISTDPKGQSYFQNIQGEGGVKAFLKFFINPIESARKSLMSNAWKQGLIFIAIYVLIAGGISGYKVIKSELDSNSYLIKSYEEDYEDAKEDYDTAEKNYKEYSNENIKIEMTEYENSMQEYEEKIAELKSEEWTDAFSKNNIKDALLAMLMDCIIPLIKFLMIAVLIFITGKIFNKDVSLTKIIAGVGIAVNIYWINLMIIPLIAKIPGLARIYSFSTIIEGIFFILIFMIFKEYLDMTDGKAVWGSVIILMIAMIIQFALLSFATENFQGYGYNLTDSSVDNMLDSLNDLF